MKTRLSQLVVVSFVFFAINAQATVLYVDLNSTNPVSPYADWSTAATNIQDVIDASTDGDQILVTNGIYQTGGRVIYGSLTNRVAVNKSLTVQSVNGPAVTTIQGNGPVGSGAVRCVYLTNGAALVGFTLTNGATLSFGDAVHERCGGGVWCESIGAVVTNCVLVGNSATWGSGAYSGTLNNCALTGNSASSWGGGTYSSVLNNCTLTKNGSFNGGGAYSATLNNCVLTSNSVSQYGGGAYSGTLNNCTLNSNSASSYGGGGAYSATLNNCTLNGNSAPMGGGAYFGTLNNCTLNGNSASSWGGGTYSSMLNNCALTGNTALRGGGTDSSTLNNCTLTGNSAFTGGGACEGALNNCTLTGNSASTGGGACYSALTNCIVYYNAALRGTNYEGGPLNYCCTVPLPTNGTGNIAGDPQFVNLAGDDFHLQSNSPCINAGNNASVTTTNDLDGNPRIVGGTVDIGAYEFQSPTSIISYAWLQQYGLTNDGSADYADADGDGFNNWNEWRAGTSPADPSSLLKMATVTNNVSGLVVSWQSVTNRTYYLQRSGDLTAQPAFSVIQSNIVGQANLTTYTDTNAVGAGPFFYRVGVQQ